MLYLLTRRPVDSMPTQMESQTNGLQVVDVHDMMTLTGKEFEVIIDKYGLYVMTKLVPLVIVVLEHLKSQVDLSQKKTVEITDLKRSIERL